MDPVSLIRQAVLASSSARLEGRVESVDPKKGVVVVRLPGGEVVEAEGKDLAEGDKVLLLKGADGAWSARSAQRPMQMDTGLPAALLSLKSGEDLARAVGSGDVTRIRVVMARVASEIYQLPAESLPPELQVSKARGLPPLASVAAKTGVPGTAVPLALLEEVAAGTYKAEAAGRKIVLEGAAGIGKGAVGLWTETVLQGKVSLWLPAELAATEAPGLPARIGADDTGARRLLDRLGVVASSPEDPSFRSLVRTLVRAAALSEAPSSATPTSPAATVPQTGSAPGTTLPGANPLAGNPSGQVLAAPGVRIPAVLTESVIQAKAPAPAAAAVPAPVAAGLDPALPSLPGTSASVGAKVTPPEAVPVNPAMLLDPVADIHPVVSGQDPAVETIHPVVPGEPPARTLGAAAALRVVCAWALSADVPSDAVLSAAVGDVEDLPEALYRLVERAVRDPAAFPEVAEFVERSDPKMPWMPHRIGLEKGRGGHSGREDEGRTLSSSVVGDLARALQDGRTADAQVLREALRSIVGEGLDGAKDPSNPMSSTPWSMPPQGERPDSGRVVVRDRRKNREGSSPRTVVDVTMNPTGLGTVGARLEAVGKELDVRFRSSESATTERIREALPELRRILTDLGFGTRCLEVEDGRPVGQATEPLRPGSAGLLDLRA